MASFTGNIGDNANHLGFKYSIEKIIKKKVLEWEKIEIRKHYQNYSEIDKIIFDDHFIDHINSFDLFVIGGGNFFELWIENSATGTTIDLTIESLNKIKIPIIFNALGVDGYKGYSNNTLEKFENFINSCYSKNNIFLSVRNDGSYDQLVDLFGEKFASKFDNIADFGFFTNKIFKLNNNIFLDEIREKSIAVNINRDMIDLRFPAHEKLSISHEDFEDKFAYWLTEKLNNGYQIIFVPHIYSDIAAINSLLFKINDSYLRRTDILISPYFMGDNGLQFALNIYNKVEFSVGMRFHLSVCCISLGFKVIPFVTYQKVSDLYNGLGLEEFLVNANKESFLEDLNRVENIISDSYAVKNKFQSVVEKAQKNNVNFLSKIFNEYFT